MTLQGSNPGLQIASVPQGNGSVVGAGGKHTGVKKSVKEERWMLGGKSHRMNNQMSEKEKEKCNTLNIFFYFI